MSIIETNNKNQINKTNTNKKQSIKISKITKKHSSRTLPENYSVIIIGEKFVGKSSLVYRLLDKGFNEHYDESIHDPYNCERFYMLKDKYINNCELEKEKDLNDSDRKLEHLYFYDKEKEQKLEEEFKEEIVKEGNYETHTFRVVDTGDFGTHSKTIENDIKTANCIVFVYAINDRKTFQKIPEMYKKVKDLNTEITNMILVGNKIDLNDDRKVSNFEGVNLAGELELNFLETSAKTNYNTDKIFIIFVDNEFKKDEKEKDKGYKFCKCF